MDYSASSCTRVIRCLGARWETECDLFEEAIIKAVEIPDEVNHLAIPNHRVRLPMMEDIRRRMAYCVTITLYDEQGERVKTLR